jgi:outer membrane immunogenic protein
MRKFLVAAAAVGTLVSHAAFAQTGLETPTSFRGIRAEANIGWDRFQSQGTNSNKLGYGGTIGFDGQIGDKIVIGPEASYWRGSGFPENSTPGVIGGTVNHQSFEEWGGAIRAGYLVTPQLLAFAKGGYVVNEQRKAFNAPAGQTSFYDHFNTTGYQAGGGVEYSLAEGTAPLPVYVNAQYVYSNYSDHTSRHRVMAGVGIRFK